ncbi:MAG: tetratricopeptide repeat protein, partial [Candidatus Omnitrophica bacterium]|nr:tetratricopeptide repeat protein [Candidatus Omnitrophota bacterium]
ISLSSHLVPRRYLIAEHKLYIAAAGFCVGLVALLAVLIKSKKRFAACMSLIVLTLALLTYQRNLIWRDPVLLWEDTTRKSPGKPRAWLFMGLAYFEKGEYQPALDAYSAALHLDPTLARAYHNRGKVYAQMKNYPAALSDYDSDLKYNVKLADIFNNRGNVYRHLKKYLQALSDYDQAIRLNPGYTEAYNNRGIVYKKLKLYDLALEDFGMAIRLDPTYAVVHNNRGNLLYQLGQREEALNDFNRAIVLYTGRPLTVEARGQLAITHLNRALYYAGKRQYEAANADAQQALDYGYTDAHRYLDLWKPLTGKD